MNSKYATVNLKKQKKEGRTKGRQEKGGCGTWAGGLELSGVYHYATKLVL